MRHILSKFAFTFIVLGFSVVFVSCDRENIDLVPGQVYVVTTDAESGYAVFVGSGLRSRMDGFFYIDENALFAVSRRVSLSCDVFGLVMREEGRKRQRISSVIPYEAPPFEEQPATWSYRDSVYAVSVNRNVPYGNAFGFWTSLPSSDDSFLNIYLSQVTMKTMKMQSLTMDVYCPEDGKKALRPLLVLIHGGAFYNGDKASTGYPEWGKYFAGKGYVVASVNYRLGFFALPSSVEKAGFRAVQDVNAAIRFLVHNKSEYYVDSDRVFVAGTSAGGITALNVAFMHEDNIPAAAKSEGPVNAVNPGMQESFSVRAVGNMWGAVHDLSMIGNEDVAIISYHIKGDPIVPFGTDYPFQSVAFNNLLFDKMYGSGEITPYARNLGRKTELHDYYMPGTHTLHLDGDRFTPIFYEIETGLTDFFSSVMLPHPVSIRHVRNSSSFSIDDTDVETVSWKVDGGIILSSNRKKSKILLFPEAPDHILTVCGTYKSGLTFHETFSI